MALKTKKKAKPILSVIKQERGKRRPVPVWNFLPYKRINETRPHFIVLEDDTYMEMLNLPGKDLDFLNADGFTGSNQIIEDYYNLLSAYTPDFDILISQLPADTKRQQASWGQRMAEIERELPTVKNDQKRSQLLAARNWVKAEIATAANIVSDVTHQEYTIFLYGDTIKQLEQNKQTFLTFSKAAFTPTSVSRVRKELILSQINNPGDRLELEDDNEN